MKDNEIILALISDINNKSELASMVDVVNHNPFQVILTHSFSKNKTYKIKTIKTLSFGRFRF